MKSIRVNFRTNNKYKENKFSFCRREKTSLATREKGWRRRGGERVASSRWRRSFAKGRGEGGLCTMHLAAAILTESDKSGENGWLWHVNIEMERGGRGRGEDSPSFRSLSSSIESRGGIRANCFTRPSRAFDRLCSLLGTRRRLRLLGILIPCRFPRACDSWNGTRISLGILSYLFPYCASPR